MTTTIRTSDLSKHYGDRAVVDQLNLDIGAGEVFGLLGPNGAGKTTTILMLLGLIEPTHGELEVLGKNPHRHPLDVKRMVGFLPDAVGFYDGLTGRENLRFTARLNGVADPEPQLDLLLEQVGLPKAGDQEVGQYSRGMKQRLGLADALVKSPSVLILDEPTTAIDPEGVAEMLEMIRGLANDNQVTVLLSSHLLHQVQAVCDRVAIFVNGVVVAQGPPHELAVDETGPAKVEFRLGGDHESDRATLAAIEGVEDVSHGRFPGSWIVGIDTPRISDTVRQLVAEGVDVVGVRRVDDDLDSIYRRYFETHRGVAS
ncbi:MAG: ABC transporter ATP-binding protein [Acidimicrobiia bacterium]